MSADKVGHQPSLGKLSEQMMVAIFSHNRGEQLKITLESWRRYGSYFRLFVFDDHSTDDITINVLKDAESFAEIIRNNNEKKAERGGLHRNMQKALLLAEGLGFRFILYTQDDVHVVRNIEEIDATHIYQAFDSIKGAVQASPRFVGEATFPPNGDMFPVDPRNGMLDVGISDVSRLRAVNWQFSDSEMENSLRAYSSGLRRVFLPDPFLAHAPWPYTIRNGRRLILTRICDKIVGAGNHQFLPMNTDTIEKLRSRNRYKLAVADDWLKIHSNVHRPWGYGASDEELIRRIKRRLPDTFVRMLKSASAGFKRGKLS